jgi:hypothetical protein
MCLISTEETKEESEEEEDNEFNNKFAIATSGLLAGYINPLKELKLKSKENATTIINYLLALNEEAKDIFTNDKR